MDWNLLDAAYKGDSSLTSSLLEAGANANAASYDSTTALMYATAGGYTAIVQLLLNAGARPDLGTDIQTSPLISGVSSSFDLIVQILLDANANPDIRDGQGMTALMYAVQINNVNLAWLLIKSGASIELENFARQRAIHIATKEGSYECLAMLLDQGALPYPQDADGNTPMHYAAAFDDIGMIDLLMRYEGKFNIADNNGLTAIDQAVLNGAAGTLNFLTHKGEITDTVWREAGHLALKTGQRELYNMIRDSSSQAIKFPVGFATELDLFTLINQKNHSAGLRFGWFEAKTKLEATISLSRTLSPVRILQDYTSGLVQFREHRYMLMGGVRWVHSKHLRNAAYLEFKPGFQIVHSWASYRGTSIEVPSQSFVAAELIGSIRWRLIGVYTGLSYLTMDQKEISPVYLNAGITLRINRLNYKKLSPIL